MVPAVEILNALHLHGWLKLHLHGRRWSLEVTQVPGDA